MPSTQADCTLRFSCEQLDELNKRASQLAALLSTLYGGGFEAFKDCTDEVQDSTLWLASDLAHQIRDIVRGSTAGSAS